MRTLARSIVAVIVISFALLQTTAPRAAQPTMLGEKALNDPQADCFEAVPESLGVAGVSDSGQAVKLEAMVLLDAVPKARAAKVMARVAESYEPLAIDVVVTGYKRVVVPPEPPRPGGTRPAAQDSAVFAAMKDAMGGVRPPGSDVVHLLTSKDVYYLDGGEPAYGLAGVADCIGGVRYDEHAFSFSEGIGEYDAIRHDMAGIIATHEIGHVMGAHHHYGNCAEGSMQDDETPCTVMFPFIIALNAGNFGTLEGAVVRGHAVDFASP